jgi:formamidopyrimidine-DNA glycosylase
MTIDTPDAHVTLVYDDVRRLGRIRLIEGDPMKCPPISKLGFDPLDKIPDLSEFTDMVQMRAVPIKALLLDQTFSAGVGNWVADEVLYHAKIHPAHYTNVLTDEECERLRDMIHYVCHTSAEVDADSNRFPEHWLFRYRWGKGKRDGKGLLPNGQKISYETVSTIAISKNDEHFRLTFEPGWWPNECFRSGGSKAAQEK